MAANAAASAATITRASRRVTGVHETGLVAWSPGKANAPMIS